MRRLGWHVIVWGAADLGSRHHSSVELQSVGCSVGALRTRLRFSSSSHHSPNLSKEPKLLEVSSEVLV